jgi:putative copper export protein
MLSLRGAEVVLWIHILAACVWIGGQVTIAFLVPLLRDEPALLRSSARRYQLVAWPAFAVLLITGLLNIHNAGISSSNLLGSAAGRTLAVKLVFVAASGLAAGVHAFVVAPRVAERSSRATRLASALLGIAALLAAAIAALYGVVIAQR